MAIKPIIRLGTVKLQQPSLQVKSISGENIPTLVQDMHETMQKANGIGIAAPQIGRYKRVIVFGYEHEEDTTPEDIVPYTILINPTIEILDHEMIDEWEGCLSIPGMRGKVPRYKKIKYTGLDLKGRTIEGIAEGYHARVLQHECDHIEGILYPQRMRDLCCFGYEDEVIQRIREEMKMR